MRRKKRLASLDRAGRYSRDEAWKQVLPFIKGRWKPILAIALFPLFVSICTLPFIGGSPRWIFVGALGISGPWMSLTTVILMSGVGNRAMGVDGETSTARVFRGLRSEGWLIINGLKISPNWDIDHVAIGPAGVLVIETKWSGDPWPMDGEYQKYGSETQGKAVRQARNNRRDLVTKFGDLLEGVSIQSVGVLWSSRYFENVACSFMDQEVALVAGPYLREWVRSFSGGVLSQREIDRIWKELEYHALKMDEDFFDETPRPTLGAFITRSILAPIFATFTGAMFSLYGMVLIGHYRPTWLTASAVAFLVIGMVGLRLSVLRIFFLGWIGTSAAFCLFIGGLITYNHFR